MNNCCRLLALVSLWLIPGCNPPPASTEQLSPNPSPAYNPFLIQKPIDQVLWSEDGRYLYYVSDNQRFSFDLVNKTRRPLLTRWREW